jgi:hypothetical protein
LYYAKDAARQLRSPQNRVLRATPDRPGNRNFPTVSVNEAFEHLEAGKARYRIVVENDLT